MKADTVLKFVDAINHADSALICELMTAWHVFVDSQGNITEGRDAMRSAWQEYFTMFPDYKIEIAEMIEDDNMVIILGHASGTYKNKATDDNSNCWRIPAAWKAIVTRKKIEYWQVYADNSIMLEIIHREK